MKKTLKTLTAILAILSIVLSFTACSASENGHSDSAIGGADKIENSATGSVGGTEVSGSADVINPERKIIKTVRESVETEKYDDFIKNIRTYVTELGGYVSTANQSGGNYGDGESYRNAYFTIRIPADRLDEFTSRVESAATVTSYYESMNDVTGEYVDVESRISVLAAEESALLRMLTEAEGVSTALEIRKRLLEVQSDLASLRAQKNTYDSLIEYSTVYLNIYEVRRASQTNPDFLEEVGGVFSDSIYDIGVGARGFAVWFLGNIIYIIIFAAIVTGGVLLYINIRKKRKIRKEQGENNSMPNSEE